MRNEPCFCGSGKKAKKCHHDIQSNSAFAELIKLQKEIDNTITNNVGDVPCQKGCSNCCYEPFSISSSEFYFIMNHIIENEGEEAAKEIIKKGARIWREIEQNNPELATKLKINIDGQVGDKSLFKLMYDTVNSSSALKYPCPFLNEETRSCSVYDVRPLVCRTYGVGYLTEHVSTGALCDFIPNGEDHKKNMVNLTGYLESVEQWTQVDTKEYGRVYDRPYPIFYFMSLQEQNWSTHSRLINELKQFSTKQVALNKVTRAKNRNLSK
ncbi:YkgJ family cysteine cluster protein [Robertmurraya massiliosenegalensis]|uniref:YkgJ family cysteine cluster protein n=1 Tax=Robertmurraya massiliosenegalensis TaxID=1287657 RepID=UPI0002FA3477|nr:SEC-C motif-containing protein [Robertmurraya massiliosenegalensis]